MANLKPLTEDQLNAKFGKFSFTSNKDGSITIEKQWIKDNIATLHTILIPNIVCHIKAAPQIAAALHQVYLDGHGKLIKTFDGAWVPRHKTWSLKRGLSSHCFPADATVWTRGGVKYIKDIQVGDEVVSYATGKAVLKPVTALHNNGIAPTVTVRATGTKFSCTPNHKILVMRKTALPVHMWVPNAKGRGQKRATYTTELVEAQHLKAGDRIVRLQQFNRPGVAVNGDWAEAVGLFIGDGCVGHRKGSPAYVAFAIPIADRIRTHARDVLTRALGKPPKENDCFLLYYTADIVRKFLPFDKLARQKRIPAEVWNWDTESQLRFVLGYIYTDGTYAATPSSSGGKSTAVIRFHCGSKLLVEDFKQLLTMLGLRCSRITVDPPAARVICGVATVSGESYRMSVADRTGVLDPAADALYAARVAASPTRQQGTSRCYGYEAVAPDFTHCAVESVTPGLSLPVFDITVADTHLFVSDGVVVSNSWGIALDFNAATNPFGKYNDELLPIAEIFQAHGFSWGGAWSPKYADPQHFELVELA